MLTLAISRYHPNPKAAIAEAEARTDAATKRGAPQRDDADHDGLKSLFEYLMLTFLTCAQNRKGQGAEWAIVGDQHGR